MPVLVFTKTSPSNDGLTNHTFNGDVMDPITIAIVADTALSLLDNIKGFFGNAKIKEAKFAFDQKTDSLDAKVQQHHSIL